MLFIGIIAVIILVGALLSGGSTSSSKTSSDTVATADKAYELSDGRTVIYNDTSDLFDFVGAPEEFIQDIYDCEQSLTGMYPSDSDIIFTCDNGYVYTIIINLDDKHNFKGVTLGTDINSLPAAFNEEFSYIGETDNFDGTKRASYYSVNGNGMVALDYDKSGVITNIGWVGENPVVSETTEQDTSVIESPKAEEAQEIGASGEIVYGSYSDEDTEGNNYFIDFEYTTDPEGEYIEIVVYDSTGHCALRDQGSGNYVDNKYVFYLEDCGAEIDAYFGQKNVRLIASGGNDSSVNDLNRTYTLDKELSLDDSYDFILPNSSDAYISESDLVGLSKDELRIARNEIYARHGRIFSSADLASYFSQFLWYEPIYDADSFDENCLNSYEKKNISVIKKYEKKMGY